MQSTNYGNFLSPDEVNAGKYNFNKPLISCVTYSLVFFAVASLLVTFAIYAYLGFSEPKPSYNVAVFSEAKRYSDEVKNIVTLHKEARPNNIHVVDVLNELLVKKPAVIDLTNITIGENRYTVQGLSDTIEAANDYAASLDFKTPANVTSINKEEDFQRFTIEVNAKGAKK